MDKLTAPPENRSGEKSLKVSLPILFEDNHLLVVNKPAGLPTQGALADRESVHSELCRLIKQRDHKPGNVYIGIVSRLDASTSGLLLLAKTSKAAARLSEQIRERTIHKRYLALLSGSPLEHEGWQTWIDDVQKNDPQHRMMIANKRTRISTREEPIQEARLRIRYWSNEPNSPVYIDLQTGRKHQVRLQSASRGCPVIGDTKYGGPHWLNPGIALHAASICFLHPTLRQPITLAVAPPTYWISKSCSLPSTESLLASAASEFADNPAMPPKISNPERNQ